VPTQEHIPPPPETGEASPVSKEPEPSEPEPPAEGGPQLYDFETDPELIEEGADLGAAPAPAEDSDDFEALGPVDEGEEAEETGEAQEDRYLDEEEPYAEEGRGTDVEEIEVEEDEERYRTEVRPADPGEDDEEDDLLSESPEFVDEDTDEGLWFEKGPPKDFDFEDEEK